MLNEEKPNEYDNAFLYNDILIGMLISKIVSGTQNQNKASMLTVHLCFKILSDIFASVNDQTKLELHHINLLKV